MLLGQPYHVHDPARPHPAVITAGAVPGAVPSDAVVLFDGRDLSHLRIAERLLRPQVAAVRDSSR